MTELPVIYLYGVGIDLDLPLVTPGASSLAGFCVGVVFLVGLTHVLCVLCIVGVQSHC